MFRNKTTVYFGNIKIIKGKKDEYLKLHCTLRSRTPINENEIKEIMATRLSDELVLDTISIYMVDKIPLSRLYTVKLLGN